MNARFLKKFSKDLDKITDPKDKNRIIEVIQAVKDSESIYDLLGVKKLVGFEDAFRIRCGIID